MPTELGPEYRPDDPIDPPQMLPQDVPVWHNFRRKFGELFLRCFYNVKVGGQLLPGDAYPESIKKSWYYSTAKRIDALCETNDEVWIIEVAAAPGLRALGQILSYASLWALDPKINKPTVSCIVVDTMDQDLAFAAMVQAVRVMEV